MDITDDGRAGATGGRTLVSSPARLTQPRSATVKNTTFGDNTNFHQGDLIVDLVQNLHINSRYLGSTAAIRPDYAGRFSHSSREPVKAYVPRVALRDQIRSQLCDNAANTSTKTLVVWGLGGAGKSQLVLDYVRQYRMEYKAIFWIEAGRRETLERDFVALYQTLFGVQSVAGNEMLMVFDGADTIENEQSSEHIDIRHFIPDVESLHVIVTSRSRTAKDMTPLEGVQVGEMLEVQAVELFYRHSQLQRDNQEAKDEVKAIVKELGYLALAVTLAATYVGRTRRLQSDIKVYLPEYKRRRRDLLRRKPESLVHQYKESVLTTWETSYHAIEEQCSGASVLMTMLSFLSSDNIFLQLFNVSREVESGELIHDDAGIPSITVMDIYKIEECFEVLEKYSFVEWMKDHQSYSMHKLVHAWGYDRLTEGEQLKFSRATFNLVVEAIEGCGNMLEDKLRLVPHVMANFGAISHTIRGPNWYGEDTLGKLGMVGVFLTDIGRLKDGVEIKQFVFNKRRRVLGENHPSTIAAMNNLAITLKDLGHLGVAAIIMKEVLKKTKRILGEEHPSIITVMNNLAITLQDLGQLDEAAKMIKEVLEKAKRILGEEHLDTIMAMSNLASTLRDLGQPDEAAKIKKEVLKKRRRILGEDHPSTITAMNDLAITLKNLGRPDEAAKMIKEVLEKAKQILGEEHLETITVMRNLTMTLRDLGQLDEATKIMKEVVEKRRRILGEEHLDTIVAISDFAIMLQELGQLDEAAKMKEVLEKKMQILYEEHLDTTSAMNSLATTLRDLSQLNEAVKKMKEGVEKTRRILYDEHLGMISAVNNLVSRPKDLIHLNEAAKMKEMLKKMTRTLDEERLDTISMINSLASRRKDLGEAAKKMKEVVGWQILDEKYPDKITAMNNLVVTLGHLGQLDETLTARLNGIG